MKRGRRMLFTVAAGAALLIPVLLAGAGLALIHPRDVQASHNEIECDGAAGRTKSVAAFGHSTPSSYNTPLDGVGHFDPTPLLSTTVTTTQPGCLVASFSAVARPLDNHAVFQVRLDGAPMIGHIPGFVGVATPVVVDPEETDQNNLRMVAANVFARVTPGTHRVDVLYSGCCGGGGANVDSAVLVLHYR